MGFMTIDGQRVEFTNEPNVLTVIRNAEIDIPTLCYHSELSIYGACRLCTVENDRGKTFASCAEPPRDGMVIYTNTPRLMRYRRTILELLLAAHDRDCTTCVKSGECHLLELAHRMGVDRIRFKNREAKYPIDESSPAIVRNPNKCILCGDCVRMCDNVQSVNAIDFAYRGTSTLVTPAFNKTIAQTNCVNCGQCRVVCPTGAISIKTNIDEVWDALADPNTIVVAQVAPAVRVALGDKFGIPKGENVMGKLVNALHRLGFHEVYDTTYGADLTVIEEAEELLERISSGAKGPLFTSCCPAWVKFCETRYPELADNISTCRSPQQMFGAVIREYYRNPEINQGKKLVSVSIMPCTAKKEEILRPESMTNGRQDVDYVLTTTEVASMIRKSGIRFENIDGESTDMPFGIGSGGGVIFGVTGGVMEAALRTVYEIITGRELPFPNLHVSPIVGLEQVKEATIKLENVKPEWKAAEGFEVKIAVTSGYAGARQLMDQVREGTSPYHFIEVMGCPGGCITGGGQPRPQEDINIVRQKRMEAIYGEDERKIVRKSHENQSLMNFYKEWGDGKGPGCHASHEYLHTHYVKRGKYNELTTENFVVNK